MVGTCVGGVPLSAVSRYCPPHCQAARVTAIAFFTVCFNYQVQTGPEVSAQTTVRPISACHWYSARARACVLVAMCATAALLTTATLGAPLPIPLITPVSFYKY